MTIRNEDDTCEPDLLQDELIERMTFTVDKGQQLLRIDKYLHHLIGGNISRTKIRYAADAGNITVNGKPVKQNYKVRGGDVIDLIIPRPPSYDLIPENIPLNILYEDEDVIVINKDPYMVMHPGLGNPSGTLINALLWHFKDLPPKDGEPLRPGLVHRIDKGTSGVVVVAKSELALAHLAGQFYHKTTKRQYLALVWGDIKNDSGTISVNIGRHGREHRQFQAFPEGDFGKPAITHYRVLERFHYVTLVSCELETGRTHQIRVHMKHIGHTLFNDERYGGNKILKGTVYTRYKQFIENCFAIMPRQALHAATLGFVHPRTGREMYFECPLPDDFATVLEKWRKYFHGTLSQQEERSP
ncbi:MAG: RluA family pseudouridine synthase [Chitinophagales bacterium]|nr:RluA family pseudouridine synthase [Chitinophagales bacterium]MDW8418315.1 RluA family pseudouridine synthase [Chitinophagales bacterium]